MDIDESIMVRLRQRTNDLHQEVEQAVGLVDRLKDLGTYGQLLSRFYGLYAPLERTLRRPHVSQAIHIDLEQRRKSYLIPEDLIAIGWSQEEVDDIAWCTDLPDVASPSEALGCLYVLEGSTLGGQVICREARNRLDVTPEHGCSFFAGYGDQTRAMWKDFSEKVIAYHQAHPQSDDEIIAAATETFIRIKEWVACRAN